MVIHGNVTGCGDGRVPGAVLIRHEPKDGQTVWLGLYRYLLWDTSVWDDDPAHRTFYGELDLE